MELWKSISEFIVGVLGHVAWPLVVLILLILYRLPITNLLQKIRRVGNKETFAEFDQPTNQELPDDNTGAELLRKTSKGEVITRREALEDHYKISGTPVILATEEYIKNVMTELQLSEEEKMRHLLRDYATVDFQAKSERIINMIWGSQYALLLRLNELKGQLIKKEQLQTHFYEPAKSRTPDFFYDYPFEAYLNFLKSHLLVAENEDGNIRITNFGVEFLTYVIKTGQNNILYKNG